ncbi:MAG: pyridoxal-phosphate dependent enzyme, partial [Synergistaceae bacterium]|nr:pyridoxal-phosphate dependent enzyme [Synergistaceae bacterium]
MTRPEILKCVLCGSEYEPSADRHVCDRCGLDGTLDVLYDVSNAKKKITKEAMSVNMDMSMWRYRDILPILNDANIPDLAVGWTPLYENKGLASKYGVNKLYIKDDGRNPTASLKDRASAVGVAKALDFGQKVVACA